jgi:hypothetical protein
MPGAQSSSLLGAMAAVLVAVAAAAAAGRFLCVSGGGVRGFWAAHSGAFFEVAAGPSAREFQVRTASGFWGAAAGAAYPGRIRGCRRVEVRLPAGLLEGRVSLNGRRIIWERSPVWYRQGV